MRLDHDKIREKYATGKYTQRQLVTQFSCDKSTVARIVGPREDSGNRGYVKVVYDPEDLFTDGVFGMGDLVFGAIELTDQGRWPNRDNLPILVADGDDTVVREPLVGIVWADGTQFEIGRNGRQVKAECRFGKIWREDGKVLVPDNSGRAVWEECNE